MSSWVKDYYNVSTCRYRVPVIFLSQNIFCYTKPQVSLSLPKYYSAIVSVIFLS